MCRFIAVKSKDPIKPQKIIEDFALMCEKSTTSDGDRQEDGWGVSWVNSGKAWCCKKSLRPIWTSMDEFKDIPATKLFVAHARSASFPNQKNIIEYNQPYLNDDYSYVFNGLVKGVRLREEIEGTIGAQKIWSLLKKKLKNNSPEKSLLETYGLIKSASSTINGFNIVIANKSDIFALCGENIDNNYYGLRFYKCQNIKIVCSEEIDGYRFKLMNTNSVQSF